MSRRDFHFVLLLECAMILAAIDAELFAYSQSMLHDMSYLVFTICAFIFSQEAS